jgi:hypothetical protein
MSDRLLTYVIPSRTIDETLKIHLKALLDTYQTSGENPPDIQIYCEDVSKASELGLAANIKFFEQEGSPFEKLVAAGKNLPESQYVVFSTADDLTFFSRADIEKMSAKRARVGVGHFLLCRPIEASRFRIFRGWTHFSQYMGTLPDSDRFNRYVGEGPVSVWGCYERSYFASLVNLVSELLTILDASEINLIEDVINTVNLTAYDHHCNDSVSLRFLDSNYAQNKNFVPSWNALQRVTARGAVGLVCFAIKSQFKWMVANGAGMQILSIEQIYQALMAHAQGYQAATSRKWREWLDVEWQPFEAPRIGVAPATDPKNPYLNSFVWAGRAPVNEIFPQSVWMANEQLRKFLAQIPDAIWQAHSVRG